MAQGESQPETIDLEEFPLPGFSSITQFSNEGIKKILAATRAFQSLPSSGPAWDLQKSYPEFNRAMKNARKRLIPMITLLLNHANISTEEFRFGDIDEKFEFLVEANDDMLERIGCALDEASGLFQKAHTIVVNQGIASYSLRPPGLWGKRKAEVEQSDPTSSTVNADDDEPMQVEVQQKISNREIKKAVYKRTVKEKPQVRFKTPVDNSPSPFVPKLKEKPNSIKPLSILPEYNSKNEEFYGHPYFVELNLWEPSDSMLTTVSPQLPKVLGDTPLVEVNTARDVEQLLRDLYPVTELAVDLEHHGYRSFLGFTCLMQISTRDKDYIIDTLALRDHLYHLNEIFTNPKIVKVFHGSSSDIEWLQKDFGLYVVNMFDTQVAAKLLSFQQFGLQGLLSRYCGVTQNKTFQLADWRIRPLLKEMVHYARQDTHSLLYIYDMMRNELIDASNERTNLLVALYEQSKLVCLKRYEKPANNSKLSLRKMRRNLNNRQIYAFMELYKWRDDVAREKDESIAYVLPNHMLLTISEQLPKEMTGILACCDPVPPLVQSSLGVIHKIVTAARALTLQEHSNEEKTDKREKLKDWVILMNSVHDVNPEEISQINTKREQEDEESQKEKGQEKNRHAQSATVEWPQPLKEPLIAPSSFVFNPSIVFNTKIKRIRTNSNRNKANKKATNDSNFETAETPFDRYQLSKEIMEMLKDPIKKEILDMENSMVRAVYETVFCDPDEFDQEKTQNEPQELEKVFTDGEFIPFNPLINESEENSKKRKRKAHSANSSQSEEPKKKEPRLGDVTEKESDNTGSQSRTTMEDFMNVPASSSTNQGNQKKKKGNFLNKLKNVFGKKSGKGKKDDVSQTSKPQPPEQHSSNSRRGRDRVQQRSSGSRSSPRNQSTNNNSPSTNQRGNGRNGKNNNNNRGKKGGKFFNFQKRGGGEKSMTFK